MLDASLILEATPHSLDAIGLCGACRWARKRRRWVGVVDAVSDEPGDRSGRLQQGANDAEVIDIASIQQDYPGLDLAVAQRVEFAGFAVARLAEGLKIGPLCATGTSGEP